MMPRARRSMMPSANDTSPPISSDVRFMAAVHCILTAAVLLVTVLDPVVRASVPWVAHLVLGLYVAYSTLLYTARKQELNHKRRLALLKDGSRLSHPRFGIDRTLVMIAERLRAF